MQNLEQNYSLLGQLAPSATLSISAKAKELKAQGIDVVSMTAGEPDFDTPQVIKDACIKAIQEGKVRYLASSGLPELKTEIVKKFASNGINTKPENIIISTGAKFAIFQAITCLCGAGNEVVLFAPFWLSYEEMIKASGAKAVIVKTSMENDFAPTKEDLEAAITANTKLIIVNSPNNPTGAVYSKETLQMIADVAVQHNVMVLSDEIYEKIIYGKKHYSPGAFSDNVITLNGFSKAYAMTGIRIGYINASERFNEELLKIHQYCTACANSIGQMGALEALRGPQDSVNNMVKEFEKRRNLIVKRLKEMGYTCSKPEGAFYVYPEIENPMEFVSKAAEAGVITVPGLPFGANGEKHIRMSYANSYENIAKAMDILEEV